MGHDRLQRSLGVHRPSTVARASFFGMVSSSCSYAASALAKSLFARGADLTAAMAFMFASTNLVLGLGVMLWLLIGRQLALAQFVGGAVMIALLSVVLQRAAPDRLAGPARLRLAEREDSAEDDDAAGRSTAPDDRPVRSRVRTRAGWADAAGYTVSDLTMPRKELLIGFLAAGFAVAAVPVRFWQSLFLTGHGWLSSVENAVVAPVLACISFLCPVGNVPPAAALWQGGISFGGVVSFVFGGLLALPPVLIYRRFSGTRLGVRLALVFWAVMSLSGPATEALFRASALTPGAHPVHAAARHFGANHTTVLDVLTLAGLAALARLHRRRDRYGGSGGLAKDPVCGMQVRTSDAPARARVDGQSCYFCSDLCRDRFIARAAEDDPAPDVRSGSRT